MKFMKKSLLVIFSLILCLGFQTTLPTQAAEENPISYIEVCTYVLPAHIGSDKYFVRGTSLGYIAKVYRADGTEVTGADNGVTWKLTNTDGTECKSKLIENGTPYTPDEIHSYQPVVVEVAEDEDASALTLVAKSTVNPEVTGTETRFTIENNNSGSLYIKQQGMTWIYKKDTIDVGVAYDTDNAGAEFRWLSYNLDTKEWEVIADWSKSNWATWKAEKGNYWLHCELRTPDGSCEDQATVCFAYTAGNTQISGTYAGYQSSDEILLGCDSYSKQSGETYSFKIYDLDNKSWIYLTDKNAAQWITWQPQKGNYWVHYELYTADGRLSDTRTYCFAVNTPTIFTN